MKIIKPKRLQKGDVIGLVSPASAPNKEEKIEKSIKYLEQLGYRIKLGKNVSKVHGYLAGTDKERAKDFNDMINNENVKAIFALRGGYGTPRILRMIDYNSLKRNPKIVVGYSDITALQLAIFRKTGLVTFSGPMPASDMWQGLDSYTEENFWRVLSSTKKIGLLSNPKDEPLQVIKQGKAQGRLIGGTISLLVSLLSTPFQPQFCNTILVIEDIDEAPHRVDRMLSQLYNAGILKSLSALIFGKFVNCIPPDPSEPNLTLEQVQKEYAEKVKCPVIANLQYGHVTPKLTIPLGIRASIDTKQNGITILEGAVV